MCGFSFWWIESHKIIFNFVFNDNLKCIFNCVRTKLYFYVRNFFLPCCTWTFCSDLWCGMFFFCWRINQMSFQHWIITFVLFVCSLVKRKARAANELIKCLLNGSKCIVNRHTFSPHHFAAAVNHRHTYGTWCGGTFESDLSWTQHSSLSHFLSWWRRWWEWISYITIISI